MKKDEADIQKENREQISVIIPFHNAADYLNRILTQVTGQTYENLEILPVNDGSDDESALLCEGWDEKDRRITFLDPGWKESHGVSAARNEGLLQSHGAYVLFLDADDQIAPDMIETLFGEFERFESEYHLRADFAVCGFFEERSKTDRAEILPMKTSYAGRSMMEAIFSDPGFFSAVWNKLFRREALWDENGELILFEEGVHIAEDTLFLIKVMRHARYAAAVQRPLYRWIRRYSSATKGAKGVNFELTYRNLSILKACRLMRRELSSCDGGLCHFIEKIYLGLLRDFLLEAKKENREDLKERLLKQAEREIGQFKRRNLKDGLFEAKYRLCLELVKKDAPDPVLQKINAVRG